MREDEENIVVLIVDDNHKVRVRLRLLLEATGYTVFTATDGLSALTLLQQLSLVPRLIILDLVMPIMDGWEFLEAIRAQPQWESVAVVLHTSSREGLPLDVPRMRKNATDVEILDVARQYCGRK